jgi:hypothetical protein
MLKLVISLSLCELFQRYVMHCTIDMHPEEVNQFSEDETADANGFTKAVDKGSADAVAFSTVLLFTDSIKLAFLLSSHTVHNTAVPAELYLRSSAAYYGLQQTV